MDKDREHEAFGGAELLLSFLLPSIFSFLLQQDGGSCELDTLFLPSIHCAYICTASLSFGINCCSDLTVKLCVGMIKY